MRHPRSLTPTAALRATAALCAATLLAACASPAEPTAADVGYAEPRRPQPSASALPSALNTEAADRAASTGAAAYAEQVKRAVAEAEDAVAAGVVAYFSLDGTTGAPEKILADFERQLSKYGTHGFAHGSVDVKAAIPGYIEKLHFERAMERAEIESITLDESTDPNLGLMTFDVDASTQRKTQMTNWTEVEDLDLQVTVLNDQGRWLIDLIEPDES